jgi:hypothetical protein
MTTLRNLVTGTATPASPWGRRSVRCPGSVVGVTVANVDVAEAWREAGDMVRCAVMRPGVVEAPLADCEVITSTADFVLGQDPGQSVLGNPLQSGRRVGEHA